MPCDFCERALGAVVSCGEEGCAQVFHVECGRRHGCNPLVTNNRTYKMFCAQHDTRTIANRMRANERRWRETVSRFVRLLRLQAESTLARLNPKRRRCAEKQPIERTEVSVSSDADFCFDESCLQIMQAVKEQLRDASPNMFRIHVARDVDNGQLRVRAVQEDRACLMDR